jgi:hypothetical protein
MIDLTDPAKNLQFAGVLQNPIARFRSCERGKSVEAFPADEDSCRRAR